MDVLKLFSLPDELLFLWHNHRVEIILSAAILFACLRLAIHRRGRRAKVALTPPLPGTPVDEKTGLAPSVAKTEAERCNVVPQAVPKPTAGPRRVTGIKRTKSSPPNAAETKLTKSILPHIFFFSLAGSTKSYAEKLQDSFFLRSQQAECNILPPILHDLAEIELDDYFVSPPKHPPDVEPFYLILLPAYDISTELDNFLEHLKETHHDFRIDTAPLSGLAGYAVFGFGDKQEWPTEERGLGMQALGVDEWMARLTGGKRAFPLGGGDVRTDAGARLRDWSEGVESVLEELALGEGLGQGVPGAGEAVESGDEEELMGDEVEESGIVSKRKRKTVKRAQTDDLEDLKAPIPVDFTTTTTFSSSKIPPSADPKPMVPVTSPTYTALTKQGYTIVGSHSGVKICRWTKSALRGRGSCYKFSFYGIASHCCMEATPSLSCSNKCVFCWRHGTNPVSTTWRWSVDPPELVFAGMKEGHYKKIKMLKGVPGVRAERFAEAMKIRHCALSLVGEPIFYPHINELLALLHGEHISSFLVCNAQHPDQLAALGPVTQLYVSIDASNKESLKRIDRPLHRDFWERFLRCMDTLREKRFTHRTVFRLTLVKGFNIDEEVEGYANLIARALPALVEVKGVTYCGTSTAAGAGLSMRNVPFYEEVSGFVLALESALKKHGLQYGITAEHAHSCCILLADRTRFFRPSDANGKGRWHTLIDYAKFFACVESGLTFRPEGYVSDEPTPEWALWGRGGFDPRDERVDRKGRPKVVEV